jgi:hypothetical protein
MAALTSSSVWTTTPLAGINFGAAASSTPAFKAGTRTNGTNGKSWIYVKSTVSVGSTGTVKIATGGSATTDSGSAGWTANVPSGAAASQYFWAQRTAVN